MTKLERAKIATFAARNNGESFRTTRNGEVHVLGQMPNSIAHGWWFAGSAADILKGY